MSERTKILIIDDEKAIVEALAAALRDEGFQVESASDGRSGLKRLKEYGPDIVFQDIWMPGDLDGLQVLEEAKKRAEYPQAHFIVMSGHGTIETAVRAVKNGAWDFVEKPLSLDKIMILISNILSFKREQGEKRALLSRLRRNIALVGDSDVMKNLKQMVARVAMTDASILVCGENGTGKELVAQNLHYLSARAGHPLIEVNCAAIPSELIESELFGYEKGAFTGADRQKKGKFDFADGGTLFLDEIGDMNIEAQAKILRILQERQFYRVGGEAPVSVDVRVVAATNKNLEDEIKEGRFREDLFYRLNVVPLRVAPLRQRREDIPILVDYFGDQFLRHSGYRRKTFSESALNLMLTHNWPGNVRELRNFVERVYILTPGDEVDVQDLRFAGLADFAAGSEAELLNFREARARFEREFLVKKIEEHEGNISKTAESIGLERSYLHRKIKSYGIEV